MDDRDQIVDESTLRGPERTMTEVVADSVHQPWRYAGSYSHADTGLYQMGQRWYDPTQMRFTQMDPKLGELPGATDSEPVHLRGQRPDQQRRPNGTLFRRARGVGTSFLPR
jgi:RHS repeat-associated protein